MLRGKLHRGTRYALLAAVCAPDDPEVGDWAALPWIDRPSQLAWIAEVSLSCDATAVVAFEEVRPGRFVAAAMIAPAAAQLHIMVYGERLLADPSIPDKCRESLADDNLEEEHVQTMARMRSHARTQIKKEVGESDAN